MLLLLVGVEVQEPIAARYIPEVITSGLMSFPETTKLFALFAFPTPLVNSVVFCILQILREH